MSENFTRTGSSDGVGMDRFDLRRKEDHRDVRPTKWTSVRDKERRGGVGSTGEVLVQEIPADSCLLFVSRDSSVLFSFRKGDSRRRVGQYPKGYTTKYSEEEPGTHDNPITSGASPGPGWV